jgi:soluble lytic murein transglycosylase-like protein
MRQIVHEGIFYNSGSCPMKALLLTLTLALPSFAGEFAVLSTGFRLHADRHEMLGSNVRLYQKDGGFSELDASLVAGFEQEVELPAPAPAVTAALKPAAPELTARELVEAAARKNGLPPKFVHSVVAAESGYQANAVSPKGAIGLMQLMPGTAQAYGADPHDPAQNVEAGAAYLRELLIKYDGDARRALAAYNAGPGAVAKYNGVPPYAETQTYIERVLRKYKKSTDSEAGVIDP